HCQAAPMMWWASYCGCRRGARSSHEPAQRPVQTAPYRGGYAAWVGQCIEGRRLRAEPSRTEQNRLGLLTARVAWPESRLLYCGTGQRGTTAHGCIPRRGDTGDAETMEAKLIDDRTHWNRFVAGAATGHLCQTYEWPDHSGEAAAEGSLRVGVLENGELVAALLLVRSKATGLRAPFYYAPRGPVCDDLSSPALPLLIACAKREAGRRGGFLIRAEPNVEQSDPVWPGALQRLGFRPTTHTIYLRGAWVTDLRPSEDAILANMMTTWRQNIRAGGRKGVSVRLG